MVGWATEHGYRDGAVLVDVLKTMNIKGLYFGGGTVYNGPYNSVDWRNSTTLQSAIFSKGPVKLGVAAKNLQTNRHGHVKGGKNGWALYGYPPDLPMDHCVSLCGFGPLDELIALFKKQGVKVSPPKGMPQGLCYAMFTWDSIGIVDELSVVNMTHEAWVRSPVTTMSSYPTVSKLKLKNDGAFVVDIHAVHKGPNDLKFTDTGNHSNFGIASTKTMDLAKKCTKPAPIQPGDLVQLKVWVEAGSDNTYSGVFIYDPNGPTQYFTISGSTHNNSIEYIGPQ